MGKIERLMLEAMARHPEGLTPEEALDAIVPPDNTKLRFRPAYKYCFDRLGGRHMVDFMPADADYHLPTDKDLRYRPSPEEMATTVVAALIAMAVVL